MTRPGRMLNVFAPSWTGPITVFVYMEGTEITDEVREDAIAFARGKAVREHDCNPPSVDELLGFGMCRVEFAGSDSADTDEAYPVSMKEMPYIPIDFSAIEEPIVDEECGCIIPDGHYRCPGHFAKLDHPSDDDYASEPPAAPTEEVP